MPRNSEQARRRLRLAALELFAETGFEGTTAAQIAARAGVTERTFFRHFPDKREVLFEGQDIMSAALAQAIASAPPELAPFPVLHRAFASITEMLEQNRPYSGPRQQIISASPALQEREAAKHVAITQAMAQALQRRGLDKRRADLAAETGSALLSYALACWFADSSLRLADCVDRAFAELQELAPPIQSP